MILKAISRGHWRSCFTMARESTEHDTLFDKIYRDSELLNSYTVSLCHTIRHALIGLKFFLVTLMLSITNVILFNNNALVSSGSHFHAQFTYIDKGAIDASAAS